MSMNITFVHSRQSYRLKDLIRTQVRFKKKDTHWSVLAKKKTASIKALEHFDDFYKNVYGKQWPALRISLLSPHKYCAVVNNFGDADATVRELENQGAINVRRLFEIQAERIQEKRFENERQKQLKTIFEMDKQMEEKASSNQRKSTEVPQAGDDIPHSHVSKESYEQSNDRLETQASDSEQYNIDTSRIIDPSIGLSAGALQEFVPATQLKGLDDYITESEHFGYYKSDSDFPVVVTSQDTLPFPKHLNVLTFERGNVMSFPQPKIGSTGVSNYLLLNGSSLLPVLALGVDPGDAVLDMCAAPGGKSYMMLQTLHPKYLVCNDIQQSRVRRISSLFSQYMYNLEDWEGTLITTESDGRSISEVDLYDKILVDVPCTNDRVSVNEDDNNIFKPTRMKERLRLPELQAQLLSTALRLVRVGGSVVYSTCSLSPIQNDGVVHMALRNIWEDSKVKIEVRDLTSALEPARSIFRFSHKKNLRYGHLVLPFLPLNFGPLYFCKFTRTS